MSGDLLHSELLFEAKGPFEVVKEAKGVRMQGLARGWGGSAESAYLQAKHPMMFIPSSWMESRRALR